MGASWEVAVVGLLVAVAGTWAVRALVRSLKKPGACSSCAGSGACPLVKGADDDACGADSAGPPQPTRRGAALH